MMELRKRFVDALTMQKHHQPIGNMKKSTDKVTESDHGFERNKGKRLR